MLPFVLQCQIPPYRWKLGGTWKIHLQVYEFQSCRQHHEQAGQAAQTQLHVTFYEKQRIIEQTETRHKGGVEHQRIIPGPWNLIKKLLTFAWLEFGTAVGWCFLILFISPLGMGLTMTVQLSHLYPPSPVSWVSQVRNPPGAVFHRLYI